MGWRNFRRVKGISPVQIFAYVLQTVMLLLSFFMIVLILLQRGRGGGLAGAFGGAGGQSAFGAKAGDTFTRITVVVALLWATTAGVCGLVMRKANAAPSERTEGLIKGEDKKIESLPKGTGTGGAKDAGATADPLGTSAPAATTGPATPADEGDKPSTSEAPATLKTGDEPAAPSTPGTQPEAIGEKPADPAAPATDTPADGEKPADAPKEEAKPAVPAADKPADAAATETPKP